MATIDFTPYRDPKQYFVDSYLGQNKVLTYAGSQAPIKTISIDDNSLFETRLHPFIGFKIAYAFTSSDKKPIAAVKNNPVN